ncbi:hypothetical protein C8R44DRAFT_882739 [Mycena epipterygia]|nr:hypothetical protein C8R44DRAFT_882739 [Mycena epipterygia]
MISTLTSVPAPLGTSIHTGLSAASISPPRGATSLKHVAGNSDPALTKAPTPPADDTDTALRPNHNIQAAKTQAKMHRRLRRMARWTKTFSVNRTWVVYAQMEDPDAAARAQAYGRR